MAKPDATLSKEIKYIASLCLLLGAFLQGLLLAAGIWAWDILLGSILGTGAALLNLLALGLTLQRAVGREQRSAERMLKVSSTLRRILLFIICLVGGLLPCFRWWAVPIPLFFPRLAVILRTLGKKDRPIKKGESP